MTGPLTLAWRNVWRNRRRSFITMGAIAFAVVIVAVTRSLQYGTYDAMETSAIRHFSGDIQIHRAGYDSTQTLNESLTEGEQDWESFPERYPFIDALSQRLVGYGLVSSDSVSTGAMIVGVQPEHEQAVSFFLDQVATGEMLQPDDADGALIGRTMADNLGVEMGDTLAVLTQGYRGMTGADLFVIRGTLESGSLEMNRAFMVVALPGAQELFAMPDRFTHLVLRTNEYEAADTYATQIDQDLADEEYEVMSWRQLQPELEQMIFLDNVSGAIFLAFLLLLVGFEIFNTTATSVLERSREFGVMEALGMKPRETGLVVILELLIKVFLALAIGLAITAVLASYFQNYPIPLGESYRDMMDTYGFAVEELVFSTDAAVFLEPLIGVAVVSLLALIYPVVRVLGLSPMDALHRH